MNNQFLQELDRLKNNPYTDEKLRKNFLNLINSGKNIVRNENTKKHICCYFLPVNKKTNSVYLVHHIKARDWLPPGGHIERNETPRQTIYREFAEELNFKLTNEKIELFNLSITDIYPPRKDCRVHFDLWYFVDLDKVDFVFDQKEFYAAGWFTLKEALTKMSRQQNIKIMKKLQRYLKK